MLSQFDPVPTLGDGQVDFEEFVTLLGPKLSTSGIPEKFHGTDFDTVFWKVRPGRMGLRWPACLWERALTGCRVGAAAGRWPERLSLSPPKCDMQKLTVDELKRLLYDTFCEHLSMKDIENIIMTEEESHLGTAEECPVDVESEWPALGLRGRVPVLEQGHVPRVCVGVRLTYPGPVSPFAPSRVLMPKCGSDSIPFAVPPPPPVSFPGVPGGRLQPVPTSRSARRACARASSAPSPSPSSSVSCSSRPTRCCAVA